MAKQKKKELSAAEKRRLQREKERLENQDNPYAAFETAPNKRRVRSETSDSGDDINRLSNFDVSRNDDKDDYFDRNYGSHSRSASSKKNYSKSGSTDSRESSSNLNSGKRSGKDVKAERSEREAKAYKVKDLTGKQRKTRTILSYIAVFMLVVAAAAVLSLTVMFKTTEIIVNGDDVPYSDEEIIKTGGIDYRENIFLSKRKAAVKKIVESYPYVENCEVTFRIPGTQIITLEAAVPSYQVAVSEGFAIVSAKGRILEISDVQRANIPLLKGLKLTGSRVGEYMTFEKNTTQQILNEVINNINDNQIPNIYGIDISNSASIKLNYDNRITILLGMPEDVGYKLRTAMAIIEKELAATDKGDLDVSLASSDRKSSYFTPVYTNTVDIESTLPQSEASSTAPSRYRGSSSKPSSSGDTTIKSADEYYGKVSNPVNEEEDDYEVDVEDIIE